jgi:transcriptional regulator with XRE-family HTH domain
LIPFWEVFPVCNILYYNIDIVKHFYLKIDKKSIFRYFEGVIMFEDLSVANRLREIREKSTLNQKDFAVSLNISQSMISDMERGLRAPSGQILAVLAEKYHVDLNWLLLGIESSRTVENSDALLSEIHALKKENTKITEELKILEEEIGKMEMENKELSRELMERFRQLVDLQNQQLGLT